MCHENFHDLIASQPHSAHSPFPPRIAPATLKHLHLSGVKETIDR